MEVILKEHVEHLGRRGDIVRESEGYARNYLLPRKLALAVNAGSRRQIEKVRKVAEAREVEEKVQSREPQQTSNATPAICPRQSGLTVGKIYSPGRRVHSAK